VICAVREKKYYLKKNFDMKYTARNAKLWKPEFGFTTIELMIAICILGILMAISIPSFSSWVPNYRLKESARYLYSNMQRAKIGAIKTNSDWAIYFDTGKNCYYLCSANGDGDWSTTDNNTIVEKIDLSQYGSGIGFGSGNATSGVPGTPLPAGNVSYPDNGAPNTYIVVFNPRGTGSGGYVYFDHRENTTTYAVGTATSGSISLKKWTGSAWE